MKTKISTILTAILLLSTAAYAYPDWDIYGDTDIYDGNYGLINIYDTPPNSTTVNMYGGNADFISTYDTSILNVMGGSSDIEALDFSSINMYGGDIGYIKSWNHAAINFHDSDDFTALVAEDFSNIEILGGYIGNLHAYHSGEIDVYAGTISGVITSLDSSTINFYGHDLVKTYSGGFYGYGQVYGYLTDDSYFCADLYNPEAYDNINLVPEPTTFVLFGVGSLILLHRKNSKKNIKHS